MKITMVARIYCITVIVAALISISLGDDHQPFVTTSTAKILGKRVDFIPHQLPDIRRSAAVYSRIPYAEPPVGELRFEPPVPTVLEGDFDATRPAVACLQPQLDFMTEKYGELTTSEDCLFLDVIVPEPQPSSAAVMVWIHGGGYFFGAGSMPGQQPIALAILGDVIVVTLNYRLGPFGYLTTGDSEIPANVGMLDQRQVLLWVQENIAAFGGDPNRVTLFGESAGGSSVSLHLLSPMSKGLFSGAIMQSGVPNSVFSHYSSLDDAVKIAYIYGKEMGCDFSNSKDLVKCLRGKSPEDVERLLNHAIRGVGLLTPLSFRPVPAAPFLSADPFQLATSGPINDANIMNGYLSEEGDLLSMGPELFAGGTVSTAPNINQTVFRAQLAANLQTNDPLIIDSVAFVYSNESQLADPEANYLDSISSTIGDIWFVCPANTMTRLLTAAGRPVYSYYMTHPPSSSMYGDDFSWMRATHGDDIPYVFGSPLLLPEGETNCIGVGRFNDDEVKISQQIMRYWSNFAKTGNPNLSSMEEAESNQYPPWPTTTSTEHVYKEISASFPNRIGFPRSKHCYFWENIFPNLMQSATELAQLKSAMEENVAKDSQESCSKETCP